MTNCAHCRRDEVVAGTCEHGPLCARCFEVVEVLKQEALVFPHWLHIGQSAGWISEIVCGTHDGLPSTDEEDAQWDEGFDPCVPAVRLWGPDGARGEARGSSPTPGPRRSAES